MILEQETGYLYPLQKAMWVKENGTESNSANTDIAHIWNKLTLWCQLCVGTIQ